MIIADTCLIFHLFNETPHTEKAQKVLDKDGTWIVPRLWREEYANVLSKLAKKVKTDPNTVLDHFRRTVKAIEAGEADVDVHEALALAFEYQTSVYDAHFIALARRFKTQVITDDREVIKRCPSIALSLEGFINQKIV